MVGFGFVAHLLGGFAGEDPHNHGNRLAVVRAKDRRAMGPAITALSPIIRWIGTD